MAEGFPNYYGQGLLKASSAGSQPAGFIMQQTIDVMMEKGIDISRMRSKGLNAVPLDQMDWVVFLEASLSTAIPIPSRHTRQVCWPVPDPIGRPVRFYRAVRDRIELDVVKFIDVVRQEE